MTNPPTPDGQPPDDPTVDSDVGPSRTSAAIAARKRAKSERLCREMVERLPDLDGPMLAALYACIVEEIADRAAEPDHVRAQLELPDRLRAVFLPPAINGRAVGEPDS